MFSLPIIFIYNFTMLLFPNICENKTKTIPLIPPPRIIIKFRQQVEHKHESHFLLEIERIEYIFKICFLQFGNNSKANPF